MSKLRDRAKKVVWIAGCVALFGPFAIVYLFGFLGYEAPPNAYFGIWFMGALTISGIIATISFGESVKQHGWKELGCVLPIAGVTCWWGYIFLRMIGLVE